MTSSGNASETRSAGNFSFKGDVPMMVAAGSLLIVGC
jgi:hypothetical protein